MLAVDFAPPEKLWLLARLWPAPSGSHGSTLS